MIPDTNMYSRRKLMFLLIGGRYYHTSNSRYVDENYLILCGLRFPLTKGSSLEEEEYSYMKKNARVIDEFKEDLERKINTGKECLRELENDIKSKKDISFFLKEVCVKHIRQNQASLNQNNTIQLDPFYSKDIDALFPQIIDKDYAVINERLYPLINSELPIFVSFNGMNYTLNAAEKTVSDVNSKFKQLLSQKLKLEAMQNCGKVQELEKERQNLGNEIDSRLNTLNVSIYKHAIEWNNDDGIIGYDMTSKLLYCLIDPHYNYTTGKTYAYGQCAATLPFENTVVQATGKFAERIDRNSPLAVSSASHCLGDLVLHGQTLEDKLIYLKEFAHEVKTNQAFYQISNSSDSYDNSYSY